jgi:hypothetical protein
MGHFNPVLVRENVTHLVSKKGGQFILASQKRDHFSRNKDLTARDAERIYDRQVNNQDAKLKVGGRQLRREFAKNSVGVCLSWLSPITFKWGQRLGLDVSQIDFLLRDEKLVSPSLLGVAGGTHCGCWLRLEQGVLSASL